MSNPAVPRLVVGDVASPTYATVPRRRRVVEVAQMISWRWVSAAIVVDAREPVGVVTRQTLIKDVLARGYTGMELTAGDIMHCPIATIHAEMDLQEAAEMMAVRQLRHLAVVRGGRLVGLLSDWHIARAMRSLLVQALPPTGS